MRVAGMSPESSPPPSSADALAPILVPSAGAAPVLVTGDDVLVAELLRLAAAAGARLDVVASAGDGVRRWAGAGAVLVGADRAHELAALSPERREGVQVVARGPAPDPLFRAAVELGAASVLELPEAGAWLMQMLAELADGGPRDGLLVGVTGGSGGVGASVLAAALAAVAAERGSAALLDLDPGGAGQRRLTGCEDADGVSWSELAEAPGRLGARSLREALPRRDGPGVLDWSDADWSAAAPGEVSPVLVREVVAAATRGHDCVVLDIPRPVPTWAREALARCDRVLLIVAPGLAQVAAAARAAAQVRAESTAVGAVVRCRRPDAARAEDVARAVGLPLLAQVPDQRRLAEHLDLGVGPVFGRRSPLRRAARDVLSGCGLPASGVTGVAARS